MVKTRVKTTRVRIGKNKFLVIQIFQTAVARTELGNALASNAINVKIAKNKKTGRQQRR